MNNFYRRFYFLPNQYLDKIWEWFSERDKKTLAEGAKRKTADQLVNEFTTLFGNRLSLTVDLQLKIMRWLREEVIDKRDEDILKLINEMMSCHKMDTL